MAKPRTLKSFYITFTNLIPNTELLIIKHTRQLLSQTRVYPSQVYVYLLNKELLKYRETKYSRFAARASGRVNAFRLTTPLSPVHHSYVTSPHTNQALPLASSLWRAFYIQNPKCTVSSRPLPQREGFVSSKRERHTLSTAVVTWCNLSEKRHMHLDSERRKGTGTAVWTLIVVVECEGSVLPCVPLFIIKWAALVCVCAHVMHRTNTGGRVERGNDVHEVLSLITRFASVPAARAIVVCRPLL